MKRSLLSQEQIITAIQTCARKLGHPPSRAELTRMTGIAWHPIWTEFRGMRGALRAAGLEPGPKGEPPEKAALLLDWAGVVRRVQQLPSRRQYAECGRYSSARCIGGVSGGWCPAGLLNRRRRVPAITHRTARLPAACCYLPSLKAAALLRPTAS